MTGREYIAALKKIHERAAESLAVLENNISGDGSSEEVLNEVEDILITAEIAVSELPGVVRR